MKCNLDDFSNLFTEIGESLISTSYENVCIDLVSMILVTRTIFSVCGNSISLAKQYKKKLKFNFNSDAMETARHSVLDELVEIELG